MDSLQRLTKAIEYLRDNGKAKNQTVIAKDIRRNRTNVAKAMRGNPDYLTDDFLRDFAHAYSEYINEDWLLTGEGEMTKIIRFNIPKKAAEQYADLMYNIIEQKQLYRPHIQAKASAGVIVGISKGEYAGEMRELVQGVPDYDYTIRTEGESMLPRIEDGDDLCCRISNDRLNPPIGKICLIVTKDGNAVKVIKEVTEDAIVLHSLNPDYKDYPVDINDIVQIAQVVGLVRSFV